MDPSFLEMLDAAQASALNAAAPGSPPAAENPPRETRDERKSRLTSPDALDFAADKRRRTKASQRRARRAKRARLLHAASTSEASETEPESDDWEPAGYVCCKKLRCCEHYTHAQMRCLRASFLRLTESQRREFMSNRMDFTGDGWSTRNLHLEQEFDPMVMVGLRPVTTPTRPLRRVCGTFWRFVTQTSTNKMYQPGTARKGFQVVLDAPPRSAGNKETAANGISRWLLNMCRYYLHDPTSGCVFLPYRDAQTVYDLYAEDYQDATRLADFDWLDSYAPASRLVGFRRFTGVWKDPARGCSHIKIRRWLKFAKCDDCIDYRDKYRATTDEVVRRTVKKEEKEHHIFVRREREHYWANRAAAVDRDTRPETLSLIIDAADQAAYGSPYFHERSHVSQAAHKVKVHLVACISHGRRTYGYTYHENVKHGTNMTLEVLQKVLEDTVLSEGRLPPVLKLQLDNTSKQCKSQYMMGFLAMLVEYDVFERVELSFLPVGHTHEDIDQIFSRLAVHLRKHDARNHFELLLALQAAFTPRHGGLVRTGHLPTLANISHYLKPYLRNMGNINTKDGRDGVFNWHHFVFTKDPTDGAVMRVKVWPGDKEERLVGLDRYTDHHIVFKTIPPLFVDVPPAQRRDIPEKAAMDKMRSGNEALVRARRIPASVNAPNVEVLDMLESPAPLPFHWKREDIDLVWNPAVPAPLALALAQPEKTQEEVVSDFNREYKVGDYMIVQPAKGEPAPMGWWCAQLKTDAFLAEDGFSAAHVLWHKWNAATKRFEPEKVKGRNGWDVVYTATVQESVKMAKQGRTGVRVAVASKNKVEFWKRNFAAAAVSDESSGSVSADSEVSESESD